MLFMLGLALAAVVLWWARELSGELFTVATIALCLYQLIH